jgi:hypothetical protein
MRGQDNAGLLLNRVLNSRQGRTYARVVVNLAIFDRHVEVDSNEDTLAGKI